MRTQDETRCCNHIPVVSTACSLNLSHGIHQERGLQAPQTQGNFQSSSLSGPKEINHKEPCTNLVLLLGICWGSVWQGLAGKQLAFWFYCIARAFYLKPLKASDLWRRLEKSDLILLTLHVERINVGQVFCLQSWCVIYNKIQELQKFVGECRYEGFIVNVSACVVR